MRNQQIPFTDFMNLSVQRSHAPAFNGFESVTEDMPLRMPAKRLLYIAGVRFVPLCPESLANLLAFLTGH